MVNFNPLEKIVDFKRFSVQKKNKINHSVEKIVAKGRVSSVLEIHHPNTH
jgi:hypothetical protein